MNFFKEFGLCGILGEVGIIDIKNYRLSSKNPTICF
jgi:hypothetical protein